jgi:enterochelin esterase-like enzyme
MYGWIRRIGVIAAIGCAAVASTATATATTGHHKVQAAKATRHGARHARPGTTRRDDRSLSPVVRRTNRGPTGYTVTFRYYDPEATSVQIKGEWYFGNTSGAQGLTPAQWQPGDFPLPYPNAPAANWPVSSLTKDQRTGIWSYTTPLPSGVFSYGFFVNCASPTQSGCTEIPDPSNKPWNLHDDVSAGSAEPTSQVYVPSDPAFHTVNNAWEGPTKGARGSLRDVTYTAPLSTSPVGKNYLAIYTPPGYNPNRANPYPTLYLSHGGGGNEVDWSTQGDEPNIVDNLIDTGQIQPMVVVMTNFNGFGSCGSSSWETNYDQNLISQVMPYVQGHYDVSSSPSGNAFAGLSCGGDLAGTLLVNSTSSFDYFGIFSAGPNTISSLTPTQAAAISNVGVFTGGGIQDPIHPYIATDVATLQKAGDLQFPDFINGGHEWSVWRILLRDYLTRVAFQPIMSTPIS